MDRHDLNTISALIMVLTVALGAVSVVLLFETTNSVIAGIITGGVFVSIEVLRRHYTSKLRRREYASMSGVGREPAYCTDCGRPLHMCGCVRCVVADCKRVARSGKFCTVHMKPETTRREYES